MTTFKAADLSNKPRHMDSHGNVVAYPGTVAPTAGASGDVYRPTIVPAGVELYELKIRNQDHDSGATAAIAAKVGFSGVNGETSGLVSIPGSTATGADDDYFAAAGATLLRTAGETNYSFVPFKVEKPIYIDITVTTAASTFVSGDITAIPVGIALGSK